MPMNPEFQDHLKSLQSQYEKGLEIARKSGLGIDGILIASGNDKFYYDDDQSIPFRAFGHFSHWIPIDRPGQYILFMPGKVPVYFQIIATDFWHDQTIETSPWWADFFTIVKLSDTKQLLKFIDSNARIAFMGASNELTKSFDIPASLVNPEVLLDYFNYFRAFKSVYEIQQIRNANAVALEGHEAALACFLAGGSEYQIHMAFLQACNICEQESPYPNIVAENEKSAILHYQHKQRNVSTIGNSQSRVLLIDAGCRINNYCSDITRTWVSGEVHTVFKALLQQMAILQSQLIEVIRPGMDFVDLHEQAILRVAQLLLESEVVIKSPGSETLMALACKFMPHGVGHLLGIQVHDTGGHLVNPFGETRTPPSQFPYLRNTRIIRENMVFTVEPGLYFIPDLLCSVRSSVEGKYMNWPLIDELIPFGGIRVEDNIRVTSSGADNLTCEK